jgi:nitrate reductase gamma subunit
MGAIAVSFLGVIVLVAASWVLVDGVHLRVLFGVIFPYAAILIFVVGMIWKVIGWARSPVPFRIPTTCGQEKTFPWIKQNKIDNPSTLWGVLGRMALEVLVFRSLFRNAKLDYRDDRSRFSSAKWLWLFALIFHWSLLAVLVRHLRFFTEPIPFFVTWVEHVDGFLEVGAPVLIGNSLMPFVGLPGLMISGVALLIGVTLLFLRRVVVPQVRYVSLAADWFPLFLIGGIAVSGLLMRYYFKVEVIQVKQLMMSLVAFQPDLKVLPDIGVIFFIHLFLVSCLLAYFPFSKLAHLGGIFLSPTRNMANNNRMKRHVNPWGYPVKIHTYEEYEDEFREKMVEAGLPVEKQPVAKPAEQES